jgi:hypothetical protein
MAAAFAGAVSTAVVLALSLKQSTLPVYGRKEARQDTKNEKLL